MKYKSTTYIIIFFIFSVSKVTSQSNSDTLHITDYFTFHNNKWMNIHHFLYEKASGEQKNKLKEDGLVFLNLGEQKIIERLSLNEKATLNECVKFYKDFIIDQELLNSQRIFKWLQKQNENEIIKDTTFTKRFTEAINSIQPTYTKHFWPVHKRHNKSLVSRHIKSIMTIENDVIYDLQKMSGMVWNNNTKVRIDITTYGNWAGAYSPAIDNIVISTIDPLMKTSVFTEFVFHEGSHLLFLRNSPFRKSLFETSKELNITYPRNIWHAAMFYLSGLSTKNHLEKIGIDHKLIMIEKAVFFRYYENSKFRLALEEYYKGKVNMKNTSTKLLKI